MYTQYVPYILSWSAVLFGVQPIHGQQTPEVVVPMQDSLVCEADDWTLLFEDDFESVSLDTAAWSRYYPYGAAGSDECSFCRTHSTTDHTEGQVYLDRNVQVRDGLLRLEVLTEDTSWYEFERRYTAGMVHSTATYSGFGRFEIRCKVPLVKGIWPAFWLFGGSTEVDVFEFYGTRGGSQRRLDRFEMSVHKWGNDAPKWGDQWLRARRADEDWHTYGVEYDAASVRFYFDGKEVARLAKFYDEAGRGVDGCVLEAGRSYTIHPEYPAAGLPLSVIVNVAVRGKYLDRRMRGLPVAMEVDWVRVWQK